MSGHGVVLSRGKLRALAKIVKYQEQEQIKSVRFKSEKDRSDYLQLSRETYDQATPVHDVVREYLGYVEMAVGVGLQTVQNISLRKDFLTKVRAHADSHLQRLNELRSNYSSLSQEEIEYKAQQMIRELSAYKEAMYRRTVTKADPSWRNFSKAIKLSGNSFEDLVSKFKNKLARERGPEYNRPFELLEAEQKIESSMVYVVVREFMGLNKQVQAAYHPLTFHVYVAPMPDGALLARQLSYNPSPTIIVAVE